MALEEETNTAFLSDSDSDEEKTVKPSQYILRSNVDPNRNKIYGNDKEFFEVLEILRKWSPQSEVLAFRFGSVVCGGAATLSSFYINWHFRETLYLLNYSRMTSYVLLFFASGISAGFAHFLFVTWSILQNKPTCPVCHQVRAMTIQGVCSMVYPLIIAPALCYPVAKRLKSYNVPPINFKNKYPLLKFTREVLKPIRGPLWCMGASQIILGLGVTYYEQYKYYDSVKVKLDAVKTQFALQWPEPTRFR